MAQGPLPHGLLAPWGLACFKMLNEKQRAPDECREQGRQLAPVLRNALQRAWLSTSPH